MDDSGTNEYCLAFIFLVSHQWSTLPLHYFVCFWDLSFHHFPFWRPNCFPHFPLDSLPPTLSAGIKKGKTINNSVQVQVDTVSRVPAESVPKSFGFWFGFIVNGATLSYHHHHHHHHHSLPPCSDCPRINLITWDV